MAESLSKTMNNSRIKKPIIGTQLIEIVTSGMYNDPKMLIREYIQNSCDAIDQAVFHDLLSLNEGIIDLKIDGRNRTIVIQDNGMGVRNEDVKKILCSIGFSTKDRSRQRGFRGIGRLGGLGYCENIIFETRSKENEKISVITWNSKSLYDLLKNENDSLDIDNIIKTSVKVIYSENSKNMPAHFFRVTLQGIKSFHKDELMNVKELRTYLCQVAPVPFNRIQFSFAAKIEDYFNNFKGYDTYKINVNGERLYKPYTDSILLKNNKVDRIKDIEFFEFRGENNKVISRGWYGITSFLATLPKDIAIRGLRVRQGNIAIGDENFLDYVFTEKRFSLWNIGEIYLSFDLKLNARRDNFEQSYNFEKYLEQVNLLGKRLSKICRSTAIKRYSKQAIERKIEQLERDLKKPMFIDESHKQQLLAEAEETIQKVETIIAADEAGNNGFNISKIKQKISEISKNGFLLENYLDGRKYRTISKKELILRIFNSLKDSYENCDTLEELLLNIIEPFKKNNSNT